VVLWISTYDHHGEGHPVSHLAIAQEFSISPRSRPRACCCCLGPGSRAIKQKFVLPEDSSWPSW
jgi:hypothetical protein